MRCRLIPVYRRSEKINDMLVAVTHVYPQNQLKIHNLRSSNRYKV